MAWIESRKKQSAIEIRTYDNLIFNGGNKYASLPFTLNADYEILVDFTLPSYINNRPVFGTSGSGYLIHLTTFSNKWYTSSGTSETNFTPSSITGRHTFINNRNNKNLYDGVEVTDYTPTTDSSKTIYIGSRGDLQQFSYFFEGTIHEFKITSISTGNIIAWYKPAAIYISDYNLGVVKTGLLNIVDNTFIECGISVSNNS